MMNKPWMDSKKSRNIGLAVFAASLLPVVLCCYVAYSRISLPLNLEWGEGAGFNQIHWILAGFPLYREPDLSFAPLVYTPLYYFLAAGAAKLIGSILFSARLLSFLASLAGAGLIGWIVGREVKRPICGWYAGALYLGCFALADGYYDLVRVDSLYVFVCLAVLAGFLRAKKSWAFAGAGLLIAVGFYTKQSALLVFLPLVLAALVSKRPQSWFLAGGMLLGLAAPYFLINHLSGGWFGYYIFKLPQQHGLSILSLIRFWTGDIFRPLGVAVGFGLAGWMQSGSSLPLNSASQAGTRLGRFVRRLSGQGLAESSWSKWVLVLFGLGAVGAAWVTRSANGGGANNTMTAFAAIAIWFGLGIDAVLNLVETGHPRWIVLTYTLVAVQFLGLLYNPFNFIPTRDEIQANQALLDVLEAVDGPVLIPYQSNLPTLAGKASSIHAVNLFEMTGYFHGDVQPEGIRILDQIQGRICDRTYDVIVIDQPLPWFAGQLQAAYKRVDLGLLPEYAQRSHVLAWQGGWQRIYLPKENAVLEDCPHP